MGFKEGNVSMPAPHQPEMADGSSQYERVEIEFMRKEFNLSKYADVTLRDLREDPSHDIDWCMRVKAMHRKQSRKEQRRHAH